jgi:hypothetical protein
MSALVPEPDGRHLSAARSDLITRHRYQYPRVTLIATGRAESSERVKGAPVEASDELCHNPLENGARPVR